MLGGWWFRWCRHPPSIPRISSHQQPAPGCSGETNIAPPSTVQLKLCLYKSNHNENLLFRGFLYSRTETPKANFGFINLTNPGCWPVTAEYVLAPVLPLLPASCCTNGTGQLCKGYIGYTEMAPIHTVQLYRIQLRPVSLSGMNNNKYIGPQGVKLFAYASKPGQTI